MHRCSDEAFLIKKAIDDAIQNSFEKVMKYATNRIRLPQRCNMYHRAHHYNKQKGEINTIPMETTTSTVSPTTTEVIVTTTELALSPVLSDVFARQIELSKIKKPSNPCECEVQNCPSKCFTSTTLATITSSTTSSSSSSSPPPYPNSTSPDVESNSKESQLLVNSYPFIFHNLQFIFFIFLFFYY
uniref:Uncharacterized protein n=1 Tax=Caenorhabditis japonica TaxID=281687 RepID=A0A8R1HJU0_CAEJA